MSRWCYAALYNFSLQTCENNKIVIQNPANARSVHADDVNSARALLIGIPEIKIEDKTFAWSYWDH